MNQHRFGDPGPVALALFGFNLVVLGLREVVSADAASALLYAILIAGIGQASAAALSVLRGETFLPAVIGTFGLWLVGFYHLLGSDPHHVSEGVYTLVLLGPIAFFGLVSFQGANNVLKYAFVTVGLAVLSLGLGFLMESHTLAVVGGLFAFACAPSVWYLSYERIVHAMALEPAPHAAEPAPRERLATFH